MQRQPLQAFVQQFDLLALCMHLTDHLHEYLEQMQVSVTHLLPGQCTRALILTIRDVINKSAQKDHMLSFVGIDPQGLPPLSIPIHSTKKAPASANCAISFQAPENERRFER